MARVRVFKSYLKTPFLILLTLEVCIVFFCVYLAGYLRFLDGPDQFFQIVEDLWYQAATLAIVTPISMLATGLYQGNIREGMAGIFLRLILSHVASGILITILYYLLPEVFPGRGIMALALLQSLFIIGTLRAIFLELVDTETFKKRVLVYGAGKTAAHIGTKLRRKSDRRSFTIVGYILLEFQKQRQAIEDKELVQLPDGLLEYAREHAIDEIVVATSDIDAEIPVDDLVECKLNGIAVLDILSFFEREVGQIRIDIMDPKWLVFSEGFNKSQIKDSFKRVFDIATSLVILTVALPFMLLTIIAIKIEDGLKSPILYHQVRVGLRGREYKVYKFRSMITDAEKAGKAIWASKTDSRVTRVGSLIRKTRIDELPQIYNVLNGSMSFVGPRPERPEIIEELAREIPYYHDRHLVKPGITGWAQLMYPYGSSLNDSYQKQLFDMYYVKNHSLFLDFLVLLQTVEVVLFGKGAR
jgi:sugar transferase (PEP-CTERM system associated)